MAKSNMQLVIYEGHLVAEPEMRYTGTGTAVTNFRIGSNYSYKGKDGESITKVTWLRVTVWGKLAEIIKQYATKGSHVIVTGRLTPEEDGNPKTFERANKEVSASYELTASSVNIVGGGKSAEQVSESEEDMSWLNEEA